MKSKNTIICIFVFITTSIFGQEKGKFQIYVSNSRYNEQTKIKLQENDRFRYYKYLSTYYIDRQREDTINYQYVDEGLDNLFPSKLDSGILCLNIENKYYRDVRDYDPAHPLFKEGIGELMKLINYVKLQRPNVDVGIYGIPFNFYWRSQEKVNGSNKLEPLLRLVDFISPSLYIHYPDRQRGKDNNIHYLRRNLEVALEYGSKLNKPVIPYIWYIIHPANRKFGRQIIDPPAMHNYLTFIRSFEYNGVKSSGVIWWEPSGTDYRITEDQIETLDLGMTKDEILFMYFDAYLYERR